jgi:hypothetical protein
LSVRKDGEDAESLLVERRFVDLNIDKDDQTRCIQSCSKIIECPRDSAAAAAKSSRVRSLLNTILESADLIICSVNAEDLESEADFNESRLAGLIRAQTSKQVIFTVLCSE